jgi:hypothetical protein
MSDTERKGEGEESSSVKRVDWAELQEGNTVEGPIVGGQIVASVPDIVAHYWIATHHPDSLITREGLSPKETKMESWETGLGVVVGTISTNLQEMLSDSERVNILYRNAEGNFLLYMGPPRPISTIS